MIENNQKDKYVKISKEVGPKLFNVMEGIGYAPYVVHFHDGLQKYKDGSLFFDVNIFIEEEDLKAFVAELRSKGYQEE